VRLDSFRVQNYKRIEDTGWVRAGNLTVLVGKNEAGKSAILRGLSKIKPSDGELYDGLREFPRSPVQRSVRRVRAGRQRPLPPRRSGPRGAG